MRIKQFLAGIALACVTVTAAAGAETRTNAGEAPVVVELFTSQGCNSCPPADAYLKELALRDDVVALEYHVDYWDYIGWADPFADPAFTTRQRNYASLLDQRYVYTPQMVMDGVRHEVGSRRQAVDMAIKLARQEKLDFAPQVSLRHNSGGLIVSIDGASSPRAFDVVLVSFDAEHETKVTRGENSGRTMTNVNVVRSIDAIGEWQGGPMELSLTEAQLQAGGGCAVLVQEKGGGRILAAASLDFGD